MKYAFSLFLALCFRTIFCTAQPYPDDVANVRNFIKNNWAGTFHLNTKDSGTLIGLPKPYSVPGMAGHFNELYYWDTYFTNVGLILDGHLDQAKNNVDNMIYLVKRYGFMPNGSRTYYLSRSQPPYLSMMVKDIYEQTKDKEWLNSLLPVLETEYSFWDKNRKSSIGLNHYWNESSNNDKLRGFGRVSKRLGKNFNVEDIKGDSQKIEIGNQYYAECESGWDLNPRFMNRATNFLAVDLNCNLYMYEMNFAYFYQQVGAKGVYSWLKKAEDRKALINKYLLNPKDGLFYDYDFINNQFSPVFAASVMNILWSGLATKAQAELIKKSLPRLEYNYGIVACESGERKYNYQWDYPNGWANIQYVTIKGLLNYGYAKDAYRIAEKYSKVITENFKKTNNLWEKYNVVDGSINTSNEYKMPPLMGWTAGVYVYVTQLIYTSKVK